MAAGEAGRACRAGEPERGLQDDPRKLLAGVGRPGEGRVLIGGVDRALLGGRAVPRTVGLVSQEVHVFAGTLRDDLRVAAPEADRIVVLEAGRVVEEGRHRDLVAADGPYAALWRAWSEARPA